MKVLRKPRCFRMPVPCLISSLLDNDFYKFTMQHAVIKLFPKARARYRFINRGGHVFPSGFDRMLREQLEGMAELELRADEQRYLAAACPYLEPSYLDFLQGFRLDPSEVCIEQQGGELRLEIEGYWYRSILWEVPLLALISECYYRALGLQRLPDAEVRRIARDKILHYRERGLNIAEFGTRRRHSLAVQDLVVETLKAHGDGSFAGTSNVMLARRHGVKFLGTHAHEWFMFHAARYGFKMANPMALEHWVEVYRGDLGIALADTYTSGVFFECFDKKFSKLFDGLRHDSGDPIGFASRTIAHYRSLNIDPLSKTIIFSDALNPEKVDRIAACCRGKIGMSFGIGTNFTNDVGLEPLNMVIKMSAARPDAESWIATVKLSDDPGKYSGDPDMIELARRVLQLPLG